MVLDQLPDSTNFLFCELGDQHFNNFSPFYGAQWFHQIKEVLIHPFVQIQHELSAQSLPLSLLQVLYIPMEFGIELLLLLDFPPTQRSVQSSLHCFHQFSNFFLFVERFLDESLESEQCYVFNHPGFDNNVFYTVFDDGRVSSEEPFSESGDKNSFFDSFEKTFI